MTSTSHPTGTTTNQKPAQTPAPNTGKAYMEDRQIPQMFESLMSSLVMEKPDDPISFLEERLDKIREVGVSNINWETFIGHLHPYRDLVRKQFVQDGQYDGIEKVRQEDGDNEEEEKYDPYIFSLTEQKE